MPTYVIYFTFFLIKKYPLSRTDMHSYAETSEANFAHQLGELEIVNGEMWVVAGIQSRIIEKFDTNNWTEVTTVGNRNGSLFGFSTIVLSKELHDVLFIFGKV